MIMCALGGSCTASVSCSIHVGGNWFCPSNFLGDMFYTCCGKKIVCVVKN